MKARVSHVMYAGFVTTAVAAGTATDRPAGTSIDATAHLRTWSKNRSRSGATHHAAEDVQSSFAARVGRVDGERLSWRCVCTPPPRAKRLSWSGRRGHPPAREGVVAARPTAGLRAAPAAAARRR